MDRRDGGVDGSTFTTRTREAPTPHTAASKVGAYAFIRHFIFVGATACDDSITMMSAIVTDGSVINLKRSHSSHAQKERTLCSHFESSVIIGEKSFNDF